MSKLLNFLNSPDSDAAALAKLAGIDESECQIPVYVSSLTAPS